MSNQFNTFNTGGSLRALFRAPKIQTLLVVVANTTAPNPAGWQDRGGRQWLRSIPYSVTHGLAVFVHEVEATSLETTSWHNVVEGGKALWDGLVKLTRDENVCFTKVASSVMTNVASDIPPSYKIAPSSSCHMSLRRVYQQPSSFRQLLQALAGVILFGTPHSTSEDFNTWESTALLLQSGLLSKKKGQIDKENVERFAKFSLEFEQARIYTPILSVYELHPTKVKTSLVSSKKIHLTSKEFVTTHSRQEELLGINTDHQNLCNVDVAGNEFAKLVDFLTTVLEEARLRIVNGSPQYRAASALYNWTVADSDEFPAIKSDGSTSEDERSDVRRVRLPLKHWENKSEISSAIRSDTLTKDATAGSSDGGFEIVPSVSDISSARQGSKLPCYILPLSRNKRFFGRSDVLREISSTFFSSSEVENDLGEEGASEAKTFAICGPGGMGKTQIAAEFAFSRKDQFDAIFWIFAETAMKVSEGFSKIALELELVDPDSVDIRDPVVMRDLVKSWLANPLKAADLSDKGYADRASWLLVLDNADDLTILEDLWPLDGPGCVLLTSRDPLAKHSNYLGMTGIDLKPFDAEEGKMFLNRLTGKEGDSAAIVKLLSGLPLAMTQMAGVIIRRDLSFDEFVRTYNEEESRKEMLQLSLGHQNRRFGYMHTLASVWALDSLKRGRSLLEVLSFLDPDGIPETILTTRPESVSLETFPKSLFSYQTARTELLQCSLISRTAETIQVHRLIQDVARIKLGRPELTAVFSAAVSLVTTMWPFEAFGWRHDVARWRVCEQIFPHVLSLRQHHSRSDFHLGSFNEDMQFAKLLTDVGWYSSESGNFVVSLPLFIDAQSIAERLASSLSPHSRMDGSDTDQVDSLLAEIHHNIGCVSTETNDPKGALTHFKVFNQLMMQKPDPPGKDKSLAISWNELGNGYMLNEMWMEGLESFKTSISTMKRVDDFQWTDISFPLVNLGLAYRFTNQLEEASKTLLEGLRHREDAYGVGDKESFITGRFLYALGNVKTAQGLAQEGHSYHSKALSQYLSTIGRNHHRTGDAYVKMAEHYYSFEQYEQALLYLNQALRIFAPRAFLKPEKARALFKRTSVLKALGRPEQAAADRKESVELYYEVSAGIDGVKKRSEDLTDADFERNIAFWSR